MVLAATLLIAFLVCHFIVYVFTRRNGKEEGAFLGRIGISLLILAAVGGVSLVVFLVFKGVAYVFQHVITFDDNMAIFVTALALATVFTVLSLTVQPVLAVISKRVAEKSHNKAIGMAVYCIPKLTIDSFAIYILLQSLPGVEIRNPYIAIFLATLLFVPDLLISLKKNDTYDTPA